MATALAGLSGRTAMSAMRLAARGRCLTQFQLHPTSVETLRPARDARDERVVRGQADRRILGARSTPRPSASSQMKPHEAPLSCDGKMPYDVRSTMRFGSLGENTSWFEAGKRPLAAAGMLEQEEGARGRARKKSFTHAAHRSVPRALEARGHRVGERRVSRFCVSFGARRWLRGRTTRRSRGSRRRGHRAPARRDGRTDDSRGERPR